MRIENLTFIGEPSQPYMDEQEHEVYLAEKMICDQLHGAIIAEGESRKALIRLIEAYGGKCEEKGRHDVREDWAESNTGAGV